jgi:hypothetical protein
MGMETSQPLPTIGSPKCMIFPTSNVFEEWWHFGGHQTPYQPRMGSCFVKVPVRGDNWFFVATFTTHHIEVIHFLPFSWLKYRVKEGEGEC